jgi:hypothetical protein
MSDSTEKLLWAIGIIAIVGIVLAALNGYISGLLATITGGGI